MTQNWSQIYNLIKFFFFEFWLGQVAQNWESNWNLIGFSLCFTYYYYYYYYIYIYIWQSSIYCTRWFRLCMFWVHFSFCMVLWSNLHMTVFGIEVWILIFLLHVQVPILGYLRDNKIFKFIQFKKNRMLHIYFLGCDIYQHHSEMEY